MKSILKFEIVRLSVIKTRNVPREERISNRSSIMIRRSPTRIEMRLDDLQEYEEIRKAHEAKKDPEKKSSSAMNPPTWGGKVPQSEIQERIGYIPQQHPPTHNRATT